ncbi:MAG TPA: hypothetical protein V6D22_20640 [Candidatus Obscuribacterales bacterium]
MSISIQALATAYTVLLKKLRAMSQNYRKDGRAGEFWATARMKVCGAAWTKSHAHWFEGGEPSTALPQPIEFNISRRYLPSTQLAESFAPPAIGATNLVQAVEVA